MSTAIKVENLSKAYQLGEIGTGTLSRDLERYWAKLRGKEDPFLKIGEANDRTQKGTSDVVWSLKDLNFEIEQGDAVGIIGRNGAGKSTLLKILSRVTSPTTGSVKIKGRVASLLEVGTGFHPELSGRENIFLNGAILGMRKAEIKKHFDAIVDFAGIERYIDTPVKRYSSGMYVRLAFAVAAHLESEILVVDEVLAVGDAEFQKKCLGKMNDVSKGEGRTVLFVSHNMGSVRQLCNSGVLLENGNIKNIGGISSCISSYLDGNKKSLNFITENNPQLPICILEVELLNQKKELLDINDKIELRIKFIVNNAIGKHSIAVRLHKENTIISTNIVEMNRDKILDKKKGEYEVIMRDFPTRLLKAGTYGFDFFAGIMRASPVQSIEEKLLFDIDLLNENNHESIYSKERPGFIGVDVNWEHVK